eukprot:scaffold26100_cov31-Attheya_sp.AAC.2
MDSASTMLKALGEITALNTELQENIYFWDTDRCTYLHRSTKNTVERLEEEREPFDDISNGGKDDVGGYFLSIPPNSLLLNENKEPSPKNSKEKDTVLCEGNSENEEPLPKSSEGKETVICWEALGWERTDSFLVLYRKNIALYQIAYGAWPQHSDGSFKLVSATCDGEVRRKKYERRCEMSGNWITKEHPE